MEFILDKGTHQFSLIEGLLQMEKFIGNTPLYPLNRVFHKQGVKIFAKLEWQQFGSSVKSRTAYHIIKKAIFAGELNRERTLLDASSGNTGIAYASICCLLGISVTICIPENASVERIRKLKSLGVEVLLTSELEATDGAQNRAKELHQAHPEKYFYADQYTNENNWKAHYKTTGPEIVEQLEEEHITHFVAGLGTSGTIRGVGKFLKEQYTNISLVALQPETPIHAIEGWKHMESALVPKIYDPKQADYTVEVTTEQSYDLLKQVAQKEGLLIGPSAAANLVGAINVAKNINEGVIVTVFPDNADKYSEVFEHVFNYSR